MKSLSKNNYVTTLIEKQEKYSAPRVEVKTVMVEDGFGTSQFNNHAGMTEQMNVVNWN